VSLNGHTCWTGSRELPEKYLVFQIGVWGMWKWKNRNKLGFRILKICWLSGKWRSIIEVVRA